MMKDYFIIRMQLILGLLCAPFIFRVREKDSFSYRYAIASIFFLACYSVLQVKVLLFLSLGSLIFFGAEILIGRIGYLPLLFLLFLSPALYYLVNVFTFSIRLKLSEWAAKMLTLAGKQVTHQGSYFEMGDGSIFSVDAGCIGLNMFCTGLCISVLLIAFTEYRKKLAIGVVPIGVITFASCILLIVSNLLRIIGLVLFKAAPGTLAHDLIGLLSLIAYTVIPVYFIVQLVVARFGKAHEAAASRVMLSYPKRLSLLASVAVIIVVTGIVVMQVRKESIRDEKLSALALDGYQRKVMDDQVIEFRRENSLIYIKPAARGYESDHPPAMCWRGNGFELVNFKEEKVGSYTIMMGQLRKGSADQYTAWWYDNGIDKTIDQLEWRLAKGEPYRIINITAKTKEELLTKCNDFLHRRLF